MNGGDIPRRERLNRAMTALTFVALYGALALRGPGAEPGAGWMLYAATWIILLHVHGGAWIMLRHLRSGKSMHDHAMLDGLLTLALGSAVFHVGTLSVWCASFGTFFTLALLKYRLRLPDQEQDRQRAYILLKMRNEWPAPVFFLAAGTAAALQPEAAELHRLLELLSLIAAAGFLVWLVMIKRAYHWVFKKTGTP
jgi:hypothetical protein